MGQTTERIESEIREEREKLRTNLDELGNRVRSATDWRRQFRDNPALGLGLAFGAGLLLASLLRPTATRPAQYAQRPESGRGQPLNAWGTATRPAQYARRPESGRGQPLNAWGAIQRTLFGVVTGALLDLVPAFRAHSRESRASESGNGSGVQGEGNYEAARRYRAGVERYVSSADVAQAARAAAPRSEAEAEELEAAENEGRSRAKRQRE
jgi:hypothetical protein